VQGRFKKALRFDQVYTGQEFSKPLANLPARPVTKWAFKLIRSRLPKNFHADLFSNQPFFLSPLVLASKVVRADVAGGPAPPSVTAPDIAEDLTAHGVTQGGLAFAAKYTAPDPGRGGSEKKASRKKKMDNKVSSSFFMKQREKTLGTPEALAAQTFDTETVYTFDYFDSFFRAHKFGLDLKLKTLDLTQFMGEQPLVMAMAKTMDTGEYLWKFDIWHSKSVRDDSELFLKAQ